MKNLPFFRVAPKGGDKINIIPDEATALVDIRVLKPSEIQKVETFFKTLPEKTHQKSASIEINGYIDKYPMKPDSRTMKTWSVLQKSAEKIGISVDYISTGGCSDGNNAALAGAPVIDGMGPVGANSHSIDEYIEIGSIEKILFIVSTSCQKILEHSNYRSKNI
jgi:glutamate carboxypeptidase